MPAPDPLSRPEGWGFNRVTLMLGGLVLLVGVIPLVAALVLFQLHSQTEVEKAEIAAHRMATLLMRSFEQAVEPIDALLQNFASGHNTSAAPYQIYEQLKDFNVPASLVQLAVTDKNGVRSAVVNYCEDPSQLDIIDTKTGESIPRTLDDTLVSRVTMHLMPDGSWRAALYESTFKPC